VGNCVGDSMSAARLISDLGWKIFITALSEQHNAARKETNPQHRRAVLANSDHFPGAAFKRCRTVSYFCVSSPSDFLLSRRKCILTD